eukprot:1742445-Pyramimonas_sp.AAC.1
MREGAGCRAASALGPLALPESPLCDPCEAGPPRCSGTWPSPASPGSRRALRASACACKPPPPGD